MHKKVSKTTKTTDEFGIPTNVTTTTTTTTDENGNVTVTVTVDKTANGTDTNGVEITAQETTVENSITDANGNEIASNWVVDGSEKKEWTEEITEEDTDLPEVEVSLEPGEITSGEATETVETEDGDTTTTTTIEREVTAETSEVEVTVTQGEVTLDPVSPELWEEEPGEVWNGYYEDGTRKEQIFPFKNDISCLGTLMWDSETQMWVPTNWNGSGDFRFGGYGEQSNVKLKYYEGVEIKLDENNQPVFDYDYIGSSYPIQFVLHDENGNMVFGYCCDLETGAMSGKYYNVSNLEDSDYYASEESEAHIRAIVSNGYWGTANGTGSLDKIKTDLKAAISEGKVENPDVEVPAYDDEGNAIVDEEGKAVTETKKLIDIIDDMTEGEALAVTQAAIWTFANGSSDVLSSGATSVVLGADGFIGGNATRLAALYNYLIGLTEEEQTESEVIDENFLAEDGLHIVVGDKVGEVEATDEGGNTVTNGVYDTALNFKLSFVPGEKDDLLVKLDYTDLDGNPVSIIKRLAGENAEGDVFETITPDADGSYTLKGLKLSENEEFGFDLRLEGTQYLEQGVYVYSPVGGRKVSQTFVGMAEGEREVDVCMSLTVEFSVDEEKNIVAERVWHDESDPEYPPTPTNDDPPPPAPPEIPDEEVPLADAPQTGDEVVYFAILAVLAGFGLAAMHVNDMKRKAEEN